ncbi:MAG: Holliday junction resolvase RuvX [Candidatus Pacebacteria bacterium]|nr:Holliday junction resolvase RuvX [Candidatus Paceibacterota bacterium]
MKYLGIDYGSKKVGFAQSDDEGRFAFPLMVSPNDQMLLKDTLELVREMKFSVAVIGESVDQNGKPNAIAKDARSFGKKLEDAMDLKVVFEKEWYSTVEARKQPGKEGSHDVDDQAAAIVLQRYLDKLNGPGTYEEVEGGEDEEEGGDSTNDSW